MRLEAFPSMTRATVFPQQLVMAFGKSATHISSSQNIIRISFSNSYLLRRLHARTPDLNRRTTKGDIYLRLLNSPNIKTVMHMLTDHVEDLDNLSVEEIHTFPQVLARPGVLPNSVRWSHMVLVLGKPIKVGTVETS